MAIFKNNSRTGNSRATEDVRRHRELIQDSIKKNIGDIIADESIIGQSKDKKIKIPIKGIKEYRFVHGKNKSGVGSGEGDEKRGDVIGEEKDEKAKGDKAGKDAGEEYYEAEVTLEELIQYLLDDLKLPDIDKKKMADIESQSYKRLGYQQKGIPPRLSKKKSVEEKLKRKQGYLRSMAEEGIEVDEDERFPFNEDDLKYHSMRVVTKKQFNAVVMCIMDVSGSMDSTKKYLARSFYFLLYQFIRMRYSNVEVVFIAHTTEAQEVDEKQFFYRGESGGTYISSGYTKALEIIEQRYNPTNWNIYAFHCSDGDNWGEDNQRAKDSAKELCKVCNLFGYGEINAASYGMYNKNFGDELFFLTSQPNFASVKINSKEDVVPALKKLLEKEGE